MSYNDAGLLETIEVKLRGATTATGFVDSVSYDAHGRREQIAYANGTTTAYTYDAVSQRLTRLTTTRTSDSAVLQDLSYWYDAAGNIVELHDDAQETLFFDNSQVSPDQEFSYDPLYRLTQATGREKVGLSQTNHVQPTSGLVPDAGTTVLRTYTRTYSYDAVGNLTEMKNVASGGNWTRTCTYASGSNRLLSNNRPGGGTDSYSYTDRGAMSAMPHLAATARDFRDQLRTVDLGSGDDAVYGYDARGQRLRKTVRKGANTEERFYLGGWELWRQPSAREPRSYGAEGVSGCAWSRYSRANRSGERRHEIPIQLPPDDHERGAMIESGSRCLGGA